MQYKPWLILGLVVLIFTSGCLTNQDRYEDSAVIEQSFVAIQEADDLEDILPLMKDPLQVEFVFNINNDKREHQQISMSHSQINLLRSWLNRPGDIIGSLSGFSEPERLVTVNGRHGEAIQEQVRESYLQFNNQTMIGGKATVTHSTEWENTEDMWKVGTWRIIVDLEI